MLINEYQILSVINELKEKKTFPFSAKDTEELEAVRGMWHRLFVRACKGDDRKPLLSACHKVLFPIRPESDTKFLEEIGAIDKSEGLPKGFRQLSNPVERAQGEPAKVFNSIIGNRIYFECFIKESSFDWALVKFCPQCGKVFMKKDGKQKYCSPRCSNKKRQRAYDPKKDRERGKIQTRVRWLSKDKGHTLEDIKKRLQQEYGKEVLDRYKIDNWKCKWNEKTGKFEYWREER